VDEDRGGADLAFRRGPAAGNRAPDGPLRLAGDGREVSLFSRLRGTPHHLLLFAGQGSQAPASDAGLRNLLAGYEGVIQPHQIFGEDRGQIGSEAPAYVDESGLVHRRYGLTGAGCYLIRPDGYVAFRAPGSNLRQIRAYLRSTFLSAVASGARR
jgi:hypothetical protein